MEKYKNLKYIPEICVRCGNTFQCTKDCWCMEQEISSSVREKINADYEECLCKNCLNELVNLYSPSHWQWH